MPFNIAAGVKLEEQVVSALMVHEQGVLYWAAIQQFKKKATKKRAVAIYETFISGTGPWEGVIADSSATNPAHVAARAYLEISIAEINRLLNIAASMGAIARFMSADDRKIPAELFDKYNELINLEHGNGILKNFLQTPQPRKPLSNWQNNAIKAKAALTAANFDIKALGLSDI